MGSQTIYSKPPQDAKPTADSSLLPAPQHVLSTLEADGTRRWLRPRLSTGSWWRRRRGLAYVLMVIFVAVPHMEVFGKPLVRLDIVARQFTIFGHTFLPTDTFLLALTILAAFISVVFITAVTGRVWCGWACPQTVYMEYLFRPIDRLFEGTVGKGGKPAAPMSAPKRLARFAVYALLSMFLAHTFLAYFVGPERLAQWIRSNPYEHPMAFLVMATTTALLTFDFYYFREQTCLIACPYGRFQSVMLDRQSLIVAYDSRRGEPRRKGKRDPADSSGHCVDCHRCVAVCPTGIDIRDGLQMECINCTQCIDACDDVMDKVGLPKGLIRYSSQDALAGKPTRFLRARTLIYPVMLVAVVGGLLVALAGQVGFDARVNRGKGAPFTTVDRGWISNTFLIQVVNRTDEPQTYALRVEVPPRVQLEVIDATTLQVAAGESSTIPIQVRFPGSLTLAEGNVLVRVKMSDSKDHERTLQFRLLGPRQ